MRYYSRLKDYSEECQSLTLFSLSADDANFYGHYPYEIEENYFDDEVLEARPGEYRQITVEVGSFKPNAWGLYDCHGNVNEWCWDYYGEYDTSQTVDPTGAESGTRHVYRGGGWNDFAKNMRSAYRAAGQADMKSYNLGVRLVRNADNAPDPKLTAKEKVKHEKDGKVLIAYFSWSGNTRDIAHNIDSRIDADIIELTPAKPYSTDSEYLIDITGADNYVIQAVVPYTDADIEYNNSSCRANQEQNDKTVRPEIAEPISFLDSYDTVFLGYPIWWGQELRIIDTFLESYDFSDKTVIPFCTSASSGISTSEKNISELVPIGDQLAGKRFSAREITIKDIGAVTSFTRTSIYNYFQTKEEIFLALMQREYELWAEEMNELAKENETMTTEEFSSALAHSLEKHEQLLKLLAMNHYSMYTAPVSQHILGQAHRSWLLQLVPYGNSC